MDFGSGTGTGNGLGLGNVLEIDPNATATLAQYAGTSDHTMVIDLINVLAQIAFTYLVAFLVIFFMLRRFIYRKLKLIYKKKEGN